MKLRNPHPDLVRHHLRRWRTKLMRALTEVQSLERALVRAEAKRGKSGQKRTSPVLPRPARTKPSRAVRLAELKETVQ